MKSNVIYNEIYDYSLNKMVGSARRQLNRIVFSVADDTVVDDARMDNSVGEMELSITFNLIKYLSAR